MFETVDPETFLNRNNNENRIIIDIRTPGEYERGHIKDAINIDFYEPDFRDRLNELDKNEKYSIYCYSSSRTHSAMSLMQELSFKDVIELQGGTMFWQMNGLELYTD